MSISSSQESAFSGATFGLTMDSFLITILLIFYACLYLWASWVIYTQWKSWGRGQIDLYDLLTRSVRCVLITLFASFFLYSN